jgi:hypothetical protein
MVSTTEACGVCGIRYAMSKVASVASCGKSDYKSLRSSSSSLTHAASLQDFARAVAIPEPACLQEPAFKLVLTITRCALQACKTSMFTRACTDTRCKLACNIGITVFPFSVLLAICSAAIQAIMHVHLNCAADCYPTAFVSLACSLPHARCCWKRHHAVHIKAPRSLPLQPACT